jgi:hypothetical protein
MKSFDYYREKLQAINHALDKRLSAILDDDVIEHGEAINTKALTADSAKQLKALKRELNLDIREIRSGYQFKINNAKHGKKTSLRHDKVNALAPYDYIKLRIDKVLLNITNIKDASAEGIMDAFTELDDLAKSTLTAPIVQPEDTTKKEVPDTPDVKENDNEVAGIAIDELKVLETRWRHLLQSVENTLAAGKSATPTHQMRLKTAEHVLSIVIEDIGRLIEK